MSDPRDDGSSAPGTADARSGVSGLARPRAPRIEVLRPGRPAIPAPGLAHSSSKTSADPAGAASPEASLTQPSWIALDQRRRADTFPAGRRRGLFRYRTILVILTAVVVIAGLLLYTYISSERDAAEYAGERTKSSLVDAELPKNGQLDRGLAQTRGPIGSSAATRVEELVPEPVAEAPLARRPAAVSESRQAAADETPQGPSTADSVISGNNGGAAEAVRAFYSALGAGDGTSAARLVVPEKRQSGPLSAGALSRYYSSFRRPLKVRSVTQSSAKTTRVVYDYVLADGRLCRGEAAVEVVQRDGSSLLSRIRTQGPC